jgi:hypothetical protein
MATTEEKLRIIINHINNWSLENQKKIKDYGQFLLFSGIHLNDVELVRYAIDNFPEEASPQRTISNKTLSIFSACGIEPNEIFPRERSNSPTSIQQQI